MKKSAHAKHTLVLEVPSDERYICTDIHQGQLPRFLEEAVCVSDLPQQQDMLLLGTLTAYSYALPHIKMLHDNGGRVYYPNLMTLIVAPAASGKGIMNNARLLIEPIDYLLRGIGMRATLATDVTAATFFESLGECGGNAFMMATEMDVLAKAWKKDYSDYSTLFRQAYEHEPFSRERYRGKHKVRLEIEQPQLSVLLSGTPNQLKPLIGSGENGLASRFLPYIVNDVMLFDKRVLQNGARYSETSAKVVYERLGKELCARWEWLSQQDHDCIWTLTDQQAQVLGDLVLDAEMVMLEHINSLQLSNPEPMIKAVVAMTNRMVVTLKRIGLILSAMRLEPCTLPETLYCSEDDFRTMILLGEKFLRHGFEMTRLLMDGEKPGEMTVRTRSDAADRRDDLLAALPDTFTTEQALQIAEGLSISRITFFRYLKVLTTQGQLKRCSAGKYTKRKA